MVQEEPESSAPNNDEERRSETAVATSEHSLPPSAANRFSLPAHKSVFTLLFNRVLFILFPRTLP